MQKRRRNAHSQPRDVNPSETVASIEAEADGGSHGLLAVELCGVARVEIRSSRQLHAVAELIGMLASALKPC